ncbi:MAG: hypothetical protein NWE75_05610 [Candidatus Bathyarchaeota archaeon]|nr:hypothetical protein [Candidatus Bathyarchaeota archaeon]
MCLFLDLLEYVVPVLMLPLAGDLVDLAGITFCVYYFGWVGFVALFELLPGLDVLPNFTVTWLIWYLVKKRNDQLRIREELERWK